MSHMSDFVLQFCAEKGRISCSSHNDMSKSVRVMENKDGC